MPFIQKFARFVIVLVSNIIMGTTGFGDAVILHIASTAFGIWFPGVINGSVSEAVFNLTIGGLAAMAVQSALIWRDTNWKLVKLLLPPILAGTLVGLMLLYSINSIWLKRMLGLVFLSVGCYQIHGEVLRAKSPGLPPGRTGPLDVSPDNKELRYGGLLLGTASGILAGLFGTGGPPLMIFVSIYEIDKDEWRASNAFIWFIDNIFRFLYIYLVQGQITFPGDLPGILMLMSAGGLGVYLGSILSPKVDMPLFRRILILIMLLGANVMLFAGTPGHLAIGGVVSIVGGVTLYILALWNQPVIYKGIGAGLPQRWMGSMVYSQVATNEDGDELMEYNERAEVGILDEGGGGGGNTSSSRGWGNCPTAP